MSCTVDPTHSHDYRPLSVVLQTACGSPRGLQRLTGATLDSPAFGVMRSNWNLRRGPPAETLLLPGTLSDHQPAMSAMPRPCPHRRQLRRTGGRGLCRRRQCVVLAAAVGWRCPGGDRSRPGCGRHHHPRGRRSSRTASLPGWSPVARRAPGRSSATARKRFGTGPRPQFRLRARCDGRSHPDRCHVVPRRPRPECG